MKHTDTELLDWWETHTNYEYGPDYESIEGEVEAVIYRVNGGYNDREWTEIGRGKTIREALDMAINNEQFEIKRNIYETNRCKPTSHQSR